MNMRLTTCPIDVASRPHASSWGLATLAAAMLLGACNDPGRRGLGGTCDAAEDCDSGFCYAGQCLDPLADNDLDSLANGLEAALGTNPLLADSDTDGVGDATEIGGDQSAPADRDGDQHIDAIESSTADADGDCIVDEYDPETAELRAAKALELCAIGGVCGEHRADLSASCTPGATPADAPTWACDYSAVPGWSAADTTCDGLDDNCDGATDEGFVGAATTCPETACTGSGTTFCEGGVTKDTCSEPAAATDATCNNVDEDCDGQTDDDVGTRETTCGKGACAATGHERCTAGQLVDDCAAGTPAATDGNCDGVDDDCDDQTDEDYAPVATTCGTGACAATGMTSCAGGHLGDSCHVGAQLAGSDMTCNKIDDDCDGKTDEDYQPHNTSCGAGSCAGSGTTSCEAGEEKDSCTSSTGAPQDADCDNVDDDCDSKTDEDYAPRQTTCGTGACLRSGVTACRSGQESDTCVQGSAPANVDTICDGVDEDCSGQADEDFAPYGSTCGLGVCARAGTVTCSGGDLVDSCAQGQGTPSDTSCNSADNDCDGKTDEDYQPVGTSCGVGACGASGTTSCESGKVVDSCSPGAPNCGGAVCGGNGCGGSCGTCPPPTEACLTVSCGNGQCATEVKPGYCFIAGVCYGNGMLGPDNACIYCYDKYPDRWTAVGAGQACGSDGESCTSDVCDGEGYCGHDPIANFTTCDDNASGTLADWCFSGKCRGFEEYIEPSPLGTYGEQFTRSSYGPTSPGANALTMVYDQDKQGNYLYAATFGDTLQSVPRMINRWNGNERYAVAGAYLVFDNTFFQWSAGYWDATQDDGTLRGEWPTPVGASAPPQFNVLFPYTPAFSLTSYVYGAGRTATDSNMVVRRCSAGTTHIWTCGNQSVSSSIDKTTYGVGFAYYNGEVVIGAADGYEGSPTAHYVLRYNGQIWYSEPALARTVDYRPLNDFRTVGGGMLMGSPPEWIVSAADGALAVTQLGGWTTIKVAGPASEPNWIGTTQMSGYVFVLGRVNVGQYYDYGIAYAKIDGALGQDTSWGWHYLFTNQPGQKEAYTITGDGTHIYVLGSGLAGTYATRAVWRF